VRQVEVEITEWNVFDRISQNILNDDRSGVWPWECIRKLEWRRSSKSFKASEIRAGLECGC
jgi:hypothetical protein